MDNNTIQGFNGSLQNILCNIKQNIKTQFERFKIYSIRTTTKKFQFMTLREKKFLKFLKCNLTAIRESVKVVLLDLTIDNY